jgi:hypothetical protein
MGKASPSCSLALSNTKSTTSKSCVVDEVGLEIQAAGLESPAGHSSGLQNMVGFEQSVGTRNHRAIPLATWELFL